MVLGKYASIYIFILNVYFVSMNVFKKLGSARKIFLQESNK